MAERNSDVLREMFIRIGVTQSPDTQREMNKIEKSSKRATNQLTSFGDRMGSVMKVAGVAALAAGFVRLGQAMAGVITQAVDLAAEQERVEAQLRATLKLAGNFTEKRFQGILAFASGIQEITAIGDEAVIAGVNLATAFGATDEQAQEAAKAAAFYATVTGKSFDESIRQVVKTFGGFAGELGEASPAIKALTAEQLKAGGAAEVLIRQYSKLVGEITDTTSFARKSLSGTIGDAFEQLGFGLNQVIKPAIQGFQATLLEFFPVIKRFGTALGLIYDGFSNLTQFFIGDVGIGDFIKRFTDGFLLLALLFQDFGKFLAGKPSRIGGLVAGGDIGSAIWDFTKRLGVAFLKSIGQIVMFLVRAASGLGQMIGNAIGDGILAAIKGIGGFVKSAFAAMSQMGGETSPLRFWGGLVTDALGGGQPAAAGAGGTSNSNVNQQIYFQGSQSPGEVTDNMIQAINQANLESQTNGDDR